MNVFPCNANRDCLDSRVNFFFSLFFYIHLLSMNYVDARLIDTSNNRLLRRHFGETARFVCLVVFGTTEPTTTYSETTLEERKVVDGYFYSIVEQLHQSGFDGWTIDSSGSLLRFHSSSEKDVADTFPIHEFLEYIPESRGIFKSLELGCCSTYSHHILGTRCLCCVIISDSIEKIPKSIVSYSM